MSGPRFYRRTIGWEIGRRLQVEYGYSGRQTGWIAGKPRKLVALVRFADRSGWSIHLRHPARYLAVRLAPASKVSATEEERSE